ncbi:sigma-70 family RNA polymerase sigma factor [Vibrio mediterranei]|uniref:sigma-70 family RNA polymerase sigma factor n=1 Tax=Vibrio mediterranei TaxID=689 RepID=UPI00148E7DF7|nr:sigma-70 family RNA polymerase sigma factor [Vibrio mediterranei]
MANEQTQEPRTASTYYCYTKDMLKHDLLSKEEEYELLCRAQRGDPDARETLIMSNLRLVVKIARSFAKQPLFNFTLLDLIAEGNIGLIKAIDKFDPMDGYRLSTYAVWWIRESIDSAIMNRERTVRLPINVTKEARRITKTIRNVAVGAESKSSLTELANASNVSINHASNILDASGTSALYQSATAVNHEHKTLEDYSCEAIPKPSDIYEELSMKVELSKAINLLPQRLKEVLKGRYGLDGEEAQTLKQLSEQHGISCERVRQLEKEGIERVKRRLTTLSRE